MEQGQAGVEGQWLKQKVGGFSLEKERELM